MVKLGYAGIWSDFRRSCLRRRHRAEPDIIVMRSLKSYFLEHMLTDGGKKLSQKGKRTPENISIHRFNVNLEN